LFHTAEWRSDVSLKDKRVAIIGTGASAVQVIPNIAKDVDQLYVFQRTPCWSPPRNDFAYAAAIKVAKSDLKLLFAGKS
jgi:cation diffusion facilitator CzcD-associated flavoprotein CzcO